MSGIDIYFEEKEDGIKSSETVSVRVLETGVAVLGRALGSTT